MKYNTKQAIGPAHPPKTDALRMKQLLLLLLVTSVLLSGCSLFRKNPTPETTSQTETQQTTESEEMVLVEMTESISSDELPDNTDFSTEADIILEENNNSDIFVELNGLISE